MLSMSNETHGTFRSKLEEISLNLEKCKKERQRRHSEFTKRIDDAVERYDKLISGRLRRLSMEGITVNIDAVRSHRREATFVATTETNFNDSLDSNRRSLVQEVCHDSSKTKVPAIQSDHNSTCDQRNSHEAREQSVKFQLRLELSFDSKKQNSKIRSNEKGVHRNRSETSYSLLTADKKSSRQQKLQRAFAKAVHLQPLAALGRHHTVLSLVPIDIGEKSQLPDIIHCEKYWKGYGSTNGNAGKLTLPCLSPKSSADPLTPRGLHSLSGKQKVHRAMKKLQSVKKIESLYKSIRSGETVDKTNNLQVNK